MLSVRELESRDIPALTSYWVNADAASLLAMGADPDKMMPEEKWHTMLSGQLDLAYRDKPSYCIIWELDGHAIGHSNVNKIIFGQEAYMHLHLWHKEQRLQGRGLELVKMTLPYFFKNLGLQMLLCEPYALNAAPNKTLASAGFTFIKAYTTVPGYLNYEQTVNLWQLSKLDFEQRYAQS